MWFVDAVWSIPVDGFDYSVPFDISEECKILVENIGNNIVIKIKKKKEDNPIDSEWQELKIDDLPRDILKDGVYEFMNKKGFIVHVPEGSTDRTDLRNVILFDALSGGTVHYRKRQPEKKQASHEDIVNGLKENIRGIVETNTKEIMKSVISLINATIHPESND